MRPWRLPSTKHCLLVPVLGRIFISFITVTVHRKDLPPLFTRSYVSMDVWTTSVFQLL